VQQITRAFVVQIDQDVVRRVLATNHGRIIRAPIYTAFASTAPSTAPRPQLAPHTPHHRKRTELTMPGNGIAMDYSQRQPPLDG